MAKESTESSVATSPSTPPNNWWDLHNHHHHHHANSLSSWTNNSTCSPWHQQNPNSNNSSCEEEVSISTSFTYASNQSGLTAESSHRLFDPQAAGAGASSNELMGEHAPDSHQLWSHVFLSDGSNGELHNMTSQDVGENLFNPLSSKTIFDPAYDYLKKMDTNWEFTNPPSSNYNNFEKHFNGIATSDQSSLSETERLNKLSNLVSHWSIAPPADPEITISRHFNNINPQTCDISLSSSMADHQYNSNSNGTNNVRNSGLFSYYGQDLKMENDEQHVFDGPAMASIFRKPLINSNGMGYNVGFDSNTCSMVEADNKYYYGMPSHTQFSSARNFADSMTLSSRLTKPLIDIHVPKPYVKSLNQSECKKQGLKNSSLMQTRMNGKERGGSNEGKKKRHDDTSEAVAKKPKTESSTASSTKLAPKVKLADKITALQQIVSPFGKTDTASVLYEAIGYIKFLQEQVELLSNPYTKTNAHKDPWGCLEGKVHKGDVKVDLSSRGLCLVPISCTPKAYHENTGSDYWTPAYRGCLYR